MDFIPHYIDNILQNLISNAIKFSPPESDILITLSHSGNKIVLKVADTGNGINPRDLERIFDLFYQGEKTDEKNGSGIGLSYTRQMIEMMNGKIEVKSEEQKGSLFTVILPRQRGKEGKLSPLSAPGQNEIELSPSMKVLPSSVRSRGDILFSLKSGNGSDSKYNAT